MEIHKFQIWIHSSRVGVKKKGKWFCHKKNSIKDKRITLRKVSGHPGAVQQGVKQTEAGQVVEWKEKYQVDSDGT